MARSIYNKSPLRNARKQADAYEVQVERDAYETDVESPAKNGFLGQDPSLINDTTGNVEIDISKNNVIKRFIASVGYGIEALGELATSKIFELLPKEKEFPAGIPISGVAYAAGWSRIINYGGVIDEDRNPVIEQISDWVEFDDNNEPIDQNIAGKWLEGHKWPRTSVMDPTYLFFGQDPAIFYVQNAVSYIDPKTGNNIYVKDEDIVWKRNGKEIHRGWYLELQELEPTVEIFDDRAVVVPVVLTIEITNEKGFIQEEIKYACINSDDAAAIQAAGIQSEEDNFTSTTEGRFQVDETEKTIVWEDDPRYEARKIYMRFQWKDLGRGESPVRKFKRKCKVKVDGRTVFSDYANKLDGQRSGFGEFLDDIFGPFIMSVNLLVNPIGIVNAVQLIAGQPNIFSDIWDDSGNVLADDRPLDERGVTDWTNGRKSALLYTNADDDEWNALVQFQKKPGPFRIEINYSFTYRSGFLNMGKKWRRTYNRVIDYTGGELNLDTPLQPIDIGLYTVNYSDERV